MKKRKAESKEGRKGERGYQNNLTYILTIPKNNLLFSLIIFWKTTLKRKTFKKHNLI